MSKELSNLYKMLGVFLIILSILAAVYAYSEFKTLKYIGLAPQNIITISGEGKVDATPDIAKIVVTVRENAKTAKEAQEKAVKKWTAAKTAITAMGVAEKDIKTLSYTTQPRYYYPTNGKMMIDGYDAVQTTEIKVRDIDNAGKVLEAVAAAGINEVSGPDFTVDDMTALNEEAREEAINDAKAKAEKLADQLGVDLVRIVSFSENGNGGYMPYMAREGVMSMSMDAVKVSAAPSLDPGTNEINSNVTITFEIK
jgi:uncharacterized protein YggE